MAQTRKLSPARKSRRRERGQGLVEFALVLPIFLILTLAAVDFGWMLRAYVIMTNAAREGARVGVVGKPCTGSDSITSTVKTRAAQGSLSLSDSNVTASPCPPASGGEVSVSVSYDYQFITPLGSLLKIFTGGALKDPLPLAASASMRVE